MKLKITYFDNEVIFDDSHVNILEIENKTYFCKFIRDLYLIKEGSILEEITLIDHNNEEKVLSTKIEIFSNYFDFESVFKEYTNELVKYISKTLSDKILNKLNNQYLKFIQCLESILKEINLPLLVNEEDSLLDLIKKQKIHIQCSSNLLDNILLFIDLIVELNLNKYLFFVDLKSYLKDEELLELYKYAIYNHVNIILIEPRNANIIQFEKKLNIDTNLNEIML